MRRLAIVVDEFALSSLPRLDEDLARAGALVLRSFRGLPNPHLLRRLPEYRGAAVVGGSDRASLVARLEAATATVGAPVIAALPPRVPPAPELRGPGVVDLLPAGAPRAADRVLLMAQVPIVSGARPPVRPAAAPPRPGALPGRPAPAAERVFGSEARVVAVASSTGGVWVLAETLRTMAGREPTVLVAQHMEGEFVAFFAEWLASVSGLRATVVEESLPLTRGALYLAAGGRDLVVDGDRVAAAPASSRYVPSGDRLLATAARALGARCAGVVLSGMGADGAEGLREVLKAGGRAICQLPATAVVPSMPESALRLAPGAMALPPEALADALLAS